MMLVMVMVLMHLGEGMQKKTNQWEVGGTYPCPLLAIAFAVLVITLPVILACILVVAVTSCWYHYWCCGCGGDCGSGCGHSCGCLLLFLVFLGDATSPEPCWDLSDFAFHISAYGSVVKHVLHCHYYCNHKRSHV